MSSSYQEIRKVVKENSSSLTAFTCLSCTSVILFVIANITLYLFAMNTVFTYDNLELGDVPKYRDNMCLNATCTGNERKPDVLTSLDYWVLAVDALNVFVPLLLGTFVLIGIVYSVNLMVVMWLFTSFITIIVVLTIVYCLVIMFDCSKYALCTNDDGNIDTFFIVQFIARIVMVFSVVMATAAAYVFENGPLVEFTRKEKDS